METADWGSKRTKELKGVMERHVQSAQTAAAQMLQGWSERVKVARKWTNWRERNRGRMGAVMWAWRAVAARNRSGTWEASTRLPVERNAAGVDALPAAGSGEWGERKGVSWIKAGTMWGWMYAWVMWKAPQKMRERRRWAAWWAREGGIEGSSRRYEDAVAAGAKPVPGGYMGKKRRAWAQRCAQESATQGEAGVGVGVRMRWDEERRGYVIEGGHGGAKGLRALETREAWRLRRAGRSGVGGEEATEWTGREQAKAQTAGPAENKRAMQGVETKPESGDSAGASQREARERGRGGTSRGESEEGKRGEWERTGSEQRPGRRKRAVRSGRGSGRGSGRARRRLVRRTQGVVDDER